MKKRNVLKALLLLASVCIVAGCNGSMAAQTTTVDEETDSEISASSELEVDYVDEYGYTYYKNPTIWTTEKNLRS